MLNEFAEKLIISQLQAEPIVIKEIATDAYGDDTIVQTTLTGEEQARRTLSSGLYTPEQVDIEIARIKQFILDNQVKIARDGMFGKHVGGLGITDSIKALLESLPMLNQEISPEDYRTIFDNDNQKFTLEIEWHKEMVKKVVMAKDDQGVNVEISTDVPVYSWEFTPRFTNRNIIKITKKSDSSSADGTPKETKKNPNPDGYDTWVKALQALGREYFTSNSIEGVMKSGANARVIFRKVLKEHPEYLAGLTIGGHAITAEDLT